MPHETKKPASRHRSMVLPRIPSALQIDAAATQYEAPGDEPLAVVSRLIGFLRDRRMNAYTHGAPHQIPRVSEASP